MFNFLNLFGHREIDKWRDDYVLVAAAALNQLAADMIAESDKLVLGTTLKEGLFGQEKFIAEHIAPLVRNRAEPVITDLLDRANHALMVIQSGTNNLLEIKDQAEHSMAGKMWPWRPAHWQAASQSLPLYRPWL